MTYLTENVRRLMARQRLTVQELVERSGLDHRTVGAILRGDDVRPQARTLHQLATGLQAPVDELFTNPALLTQRGFDRQTNPAVESLTVRRPELFDGWAEADFDELYSRFGAGGQLTSAGAEQLVERMNRQRRVHRQVALLLETNEADVLCGIVELLYRRIAVSAT